MSKKTNLNTAAVDELIEQNAQIARTTKGRSKERYSTARTTSEYIEFGGSKQDLKYDINMGYFCVVDTAIRDVEDTESTIAAQKKVKNMKIADIKAVLEAAELDTDGTKPVLVERLTQHLLNTQKTDTVDGDTPHKRLKVVAKVDGIIVDPHPSIQQQDPDIPKTNISDTVLPDVIEKSAQDINRNVAPISYVPQEYSVSKFFEGYGHGIFENIVMFGKINIEEILFNTDTGIFADKDKYIILEQVQYQNNDTSSLLGDTEMDALKSLQNRLIRRFTRLNMGEQTDKINTQQRNFHAEFTTTKLRTLKEKDLTKIQDEMTIVDNRMNDLQKEDGYQTNEEYLQQQNKFQNLGIIENNIISELSLNGGNNRWRNRSQFVWDLSENIRKQFDVKDEFYFSDIHFCDNSLQTSDFQVNIRSVFDKDSHNISNSVNWNADTYPEMTAICLLYVDEKVFGNGDILSLQVKNLNNNESQQLYESKKYSQIGTTFVFPCYGFFHKVVQPTNFFENINVFKDFIIQKQNIKHGAIITAQVFYKKK